jgi:hypothetical protein
MNNINDKFISEIFNPYIPSCDYNCWKEEIERFVRKKRFGPRQKEAIKVIESILAAHGKEKLLKQVTELAKVEVGIRELEHRQRDHVVHALLIYILGIYLNERFVMNIKGARVESLQWKIAGLLHDVAYPVQISQGIANQYSDKINDIKRDLDVPRPDVFFSVVPRNLDKLQNNKNAFDIIKDQLRRWDLRIDARAEYDRMIETGRICHGMISGLSILYVIDMMYQKYNPTRVHCDVYQEDSEINWNQKCFEDAIVPACSAIFLHNLNQLCFEKSRIKMEKAPVAYLLKLSDVLQEWERPSYEDKKGISPDKFDINIANNRLIFSADISESRKNNLRDELYSVLDAESIEII